MSTINDKDIRNIIKEYIDGSYLPAIILNESQSRLVELYQNIPGLENDQQFKNLTSEVQRWISTSIDTGVYYSCATLVPSDILDKVWDFFLYTLFPGKHLKELKRDAFEYISTAEKEYSEYVIAHEDIMDRIQSQIDIINKRKPLMKDYILKKVADKLSSMGIKSEVTDYPMESIDTRKFELNKEFNDIRKSFKEIQENIYTKFLENLPNIVSFIPFLVHYRIQQLKEQIQNIKTMTGLVFEKMRSDNKKVDALYNALKNIAEIYTDINNRFIPTLEKILDSIKYKYHDSLSEIPDDVLCLLRSITKILKAISEKCILPKAESDVLVESTISISNNMSVEYQNLRQTMENAA